jgi:AMMECR1 domain-containing protein
VKAGFDRHAWRQPETKIQGFTAEVFSESELQQKELPGTDTAGWAKSRYSIST